jgi:hypothetical protein
VTRAPDLVEPVIAFRSWRVDDGALVSPYVAQRWDDGTAVARCDRGAAARLRDAGELLDVPHESPHPHCRCGLHAYFEPRSAVPGVDFRRVLGIVAVWGRVELHPAGLRAQFARVRALGIAPGWSGWRRAEVAAIAERLRVPLVEERALEAAATEYGSPVPERLRRPAGLRGAG